ncbi:MAG: phosphoribosylglycinamide formyltransferase [Verrucomicrobia bacterium]|nr:phosphoribosylglycinamide formyltransferase [Verrucomicrobiota bacterium]
MTISSNSPHRLSIGIIGSGKGSNALSIFEAISAGKLHVRVSIVLSDVESAGILEHALARGIPAKFISAAPYKSKLDGTAQQTYIETLQAHKVDIVVLAGFMRIVKPELLKAFPNRVLNIHPSLLPAFPGLQSWKQAFDYGAKVAGCTVHIVDHGTDTGPIIVQRSVPVLDNDSPESLHARIQEQEHDAYPEALCLFAENRIRIAGRRVYVDTHPSTPTGNDSHV